MPPAIVMIPGILSILRMQPSAYAITGSRRYEADIKSGEKYC